MASFVYNVATGEFYWSSPGLGLLGRRSVLEPLARNSVWLRGLDNPAELVLDWRAGNLYVSSGAVR